MRNEFCQTLPGDASILISIFAQEFIYEIVDEIIIGFQKLTVTLFGTITKGLYDIRIQVSVVGDEIPKILAAEFPILNYFVRSARSFEFTSL